MSEDRRGLLVQVELLLRMEGFCIVPATELLSERDKRGGDGESFSFL